MLQLPSPSLSTFVLLSTSYFSSLQAHYSAYTGEQQNVYGSEFEDHKYYNSVIFGILNPHY